MSAINTNTINSLNGTDEVDIPTLDQRMAKAWVNFNGTGVVSIRDSYNISSITDNGVGSYTVNSDSVTTSSSFQMVSNSFTSYLLGVSNGSVQVRMQSSADTPQDVSIITISVFSN